MTAGDRPPCPACGSSEVRPYTLPGNNGEPGYYYCTNCWTRYDDLALCATCRRKPATHRARPHRHPDLAPWLVCGRCVAHGKKHRDPLDFEPLTPASAA